MIPKVLRHKKAIDDDLVAMSGRWHDEWAEKYTPTSLVVLDSLIDFLNRGGKRVRGALAMESYFLHGGKDQKVAIGAARVVELVQASLLIMDDIQDNSAMRRGGPTIHTQLAGEYDAHYGEAQGLNAEMMASQQAMIELMGLPAADADKVRTAKLLAQDISVTIVGQINDIYNQVAVEPVNRETIIDTLTWKTAYYTFVSPLELGACLAGKDGLSDRLRNYALSAGLAFQISDDVLGVFGTSHDVGKSADDDIREGKATLLIAYAREHATVEQLKKINGILGDSRATTKQCNEVREILLATGAKEHAQEQAKLYALKAEAALGDKPEEFLVELVRFAVDRKS